MARVELTDMPLRDMELYIQEQVDETLDREMVIDRSLWVGMYDLRGQVKDDVKRHGKERVKKPVVVLMRDGEEKEVSTNFGVQCGFTGGISRYKLQMKKAQGLGFNKLKITGA